MTEETQLPGLQLFMFGEVDTKWVHCIFFIFDVEGYAQGTLLKDLVPFITETWTYIESEVEAVLGDLPVWLQQWIANLGTSLGQTS